MPGPRFEFDSKITLSDVLNVVLILGAIAAGAWHQSAWETKHDITQTQQTETLTKVAAQAQSATDYITLLNDQMKKLPLHRHIDHKIFMQDGSIEEMPH